MPARVRIQAAVVALVLAGALHPTLGAEPTDLDKLLSFEGSIGDALQAGWGLGSQDAFADAKVVHGGSWAARIERNAASSGVFSTLSARIPMEFAGKTLELRGYLRTENVAGWAGIWLREAGKYGSVAFDDMRARPVRGTTPWTEYSVRIPIDPAGFTVYLGARLTGEGKVWIDDLQLLVDGKPVSGPQAERPKTALDTDREFDAGSKVAIDALTPVQTANLVTLGKVWGFLKYHHPKVASGAVHWDYELFRVMPRVLAAADQAGGQKAIFDWVMALGDVAPCVPCAALPADAALRPDLDWIRDRATLGARLSDLLETIYRNRPAGREQAYIRPVAQTGNSEFRREKDYADPALPDVGTRILALFRWWNVVQYWSPNRDVIGAEWSAILSEFLPRMVAANSVERYRSELLALISRVNDGHASLGSSLATRPPRGECQIPVRVRFIQGKAVVVAYTHAVKGPATGLLVGDVILTLDGAPVDSLMEAWRPYYATSNTSNRMRALMAALTQGSCGKVRVGAERSGKTLELATERRPKAELDILGHKFNDLPGPSFRRLSPDVAYLKISTLTDVEIPDALKAAEGSKGWIIDIRNYPSAFLLFALGGHLVSEPTPFARFTLPDIANPGAFVWSEPPVSLEPIAPRYPGKVVVLVDETTMSSAEYTAMAMRAAPHAIVVGSFTSGADGNVSRIVLPGGFETFISGLGVFYPDRRPTQRVGIVPDVFARPSIAGIREGRDEVLESAIRQIVGPEVPEAKVREIAKPKI